jgi:hypothetical protein
MEIMEWKFYIYLLDLIRNYWSNYRSKCNNRFLHGTSGRGPIVAFPQLFLVSYSTYTTLMQWRNWRVFGCAEVGAPTPGGPPAKMTITF